MKTVMSKVIRTMMLASVVALLGMSMSSCSVQKNDFMKKKWKIRKGHPPVQRYYNKWSPFNPHRD